MPRKRPRSSMPASCRRSSARACCAPRPRRWPRSRRLALCGETSRQQLGELRVLVVARDVERASAAPGPGLEVHAARSDEELRRELIVALHRLEELALVVVTQPHGVQVLARL